MRCLGSDTALQYTSVLHPLIWCIVCPETPDNLPRSREPQVCIGMVFFGARLHLPDSGKLYLIMSADKYQVVEY